MKENDEYFDPKKGEDIPEDLDRRYLSITEVAKYRRLSSDTLRYYDRIGLVKPNYVDKSNGRRYYSMEQCEHLGTIKELRKMNLSLNEIEEFMTCRNLEKSERVLSRHLEALKKEIEEKQKLYNILEKKLDFLAQIKSADFVTDLPVIKDIPERYVLKGKRNKLSTNKTAIEFMKLEESLDTESPILATNKVAMEVNDSVIDSEFRSDIGIRIDTPLNENDIIFEDENRIVVVTIAPSDLISVSIGSIEEMGRLCFELGNRHLSLAIGHDNVKCPYDEPTLEYLKKLGFNAVKTHEKFTGYTECKGHAHTDAHGNEHSHHEHHHDHEHH